MSLVLLFGVNGVKGQTSVFTDDFSTNQSTTYTTSGAIGSSAWSVLRSGADFGARRNTSPARLELTNDASGTSNVNGWVFASTSASSFSSPYNTTLSSNTGVVTWNFNMRQVRPDPAGFSSGSYGVAFILAGQSTTNNNTGNGYAVVLGQSGSTDAIRLVRYASGIQGTMTNIITSNTTGLTDFGAEYVSVRVTYTPSTNTWELFLRNDGASAFTDPTSGTLTSQGTAVNNTHTGSSLTLMGAWWQGSTAATQTAFFDNTSVTVTVSGTPTIIRTPASLSGFSQTSATPSAEQTYTVSGNNLTASVTLTPPTGFETSITSGSGFSSTPIVLTQSGGDLVGEPVTIYVRQSSSTLGAVSGNIAHTSTGANNPNVAVSGTRTGIYYSKSTGNLDDLVNWGLNTDGTGSAPANFTADGAIYEIRNRATATIGANWTVSGSASKVVLGDGTNAVDFTIPSGFTLTGTIDISNAAELTIENTTAPTFGTFATNSTLEYNNVAVTLSTATTYRNLKLTGTGTKTFPGNTTTITGNLTLNGITINGASGFPFSTILLAGNLTYVGTVTPPADGNSITLSTNGTAAGTQTITGAGNTVRWFRIQTTTANTILLSTTGGSSNIYLGNGAGGGITLLDGSILNMNGNDFQLFNTTSIGSAAFIMTTGTISTTSATDFTIERTVSGALGTLRFTTGVNTIGNLTLNHTGATNTLTIGNALNVNGIITVTDGAIASGGNITLKSDASSTASIATIGSGGSITGDVNVERYIPPSTRRYRFLSSPVTTTVADWRGEIFITGGGVSSEFTSVGTNNVKSNGLDWTLSGVPSMFGYTENISSGGLNTRWEAITSGNTSLTAGKGYRVFIRGDRSNAGVLDNTVTSQSAVTITSTGALNTGNQTLPVTYNGSTVNDGWNLVGNPYASTIDWNASSGWTKTNVNGTIYIYNPSTNTYGTWDGATGTNNVTQNISSGQAFFIRTNDVSPILSCTEAVKVATTGAAIFKTDPENTLRVSLAKNATNSDETIIRFMDGKLDEFNDNDDVRKFINSEVNVSSNFGLDKYASVNYLNPASLTNSVVKLSAWVDENGTYKLNFAGVNSFATTPYVLLKDKFLNKLVDLKNNAEYQFTITDDAKTKDDNRFEVIFSNNSTSIENISNTSSTISVYPNPATDVLNISVSNGTKVNNVNIYNVSGKLVTTAKVTANQINISELNNGVYFIEVLTENGKLTTKFVK